MLAITLAIGNALVLFVIYELIDMKFLQPPRTRANLALALIVGGMTWVLVTLF